MKNLRSNLKRFPTRVKRFPPRGGANPQESDRLSPPERLGVGQTPNLLGVINDTNEEGAPPSRNRILPELRKRMLPFHNHRAMSFLQLPIRGLQRESNI